MVILDGSVCTNKPFEVQVVPNFADHELGIDTDYLYILYNRLYRHIDQIC